MLREAFGGLTSKIPSRFSSPLRISAIGTSPNLFVFARLTFEVFSYYKESHKILGSTYGMLVLQDFEAITPNLLARTIETVEGGGLVVLLLKTMTSLKQLYTMTMVKNMIYLCHITLTSSVGCTFALSNIIS